jgi:cytochrome c553
MRLAIAILSVGSLVLACGHGQARTQQGPPAPPSHDATTSGALDSEIITRSEITLGDSIFNGGTGAGMCAPCHGPNGVGTRAAPSLADSQWINGDGSIGFIKGTIYEGVADPQQHPLPMPPFGHTLSDRQWQAVAAYVYALSHGGLPR